jgi:hypothetical protein
MLGRPKQCAEERVLRGGQEVVHWLQTAPTHERARCIPGHADNTWKRSRCQLPEGYVL